MSRNCRRVLILLLVLLPLSLPLGAQPAKEAVGLPSALSAFWERLIAPLRSILPGATTDGRGACDPDGGICLPEEVRQPWTAGPDVIRMEI